MGFSVVFVLFCARNAKIKNSSNASVRNDLDDSFRAFVCSAVVNPDDRIIGVVKSLFCTRIRLRFCANPRVIPFIAGQRAAIKIRAELGRDRELTFETSKTTREDANPVSSTRALAGTYVSVRPNGTSVLKEDFSTTTVLAEIIAAHSILRPGPTKSVRFVSVGNSSLHRMLAWEIQQFTISRVNAKR